MLVLLACAAVAGVAGGCANGGTASVGYSYGAYYGDPWGYDYYYAGGPVYVGPPPTGERPDGGSPPHASPLPSRPMPAPRPTPRGGGGRRR